MHNSEILHLRRGRDYCWDTWGTCTYDRIFGASKICFVNTLKIHIQQKIKKYICSFRIYYTLCNGKSSLRIKFFQSTKLNIICYFTNAYYLLLKLYKISQFSMQNYDLKLTLWTKLIHLCAFKHKFSKITFLKGEGTEIMCGARASDQINWTLSAEGISC